MEKIKEEKKIIITSRLPQLYKMLIKKKNGYIWNI